MMQEAEKMPIAPAGLVTWNSEENASEPVPRQVGASGERRDATNDSSSRQLRILVVDDEMLIAEPERVRGNCRLQRRSSAGSIAWILPGHRTHRCAYARA